MSPRPKKWPPSIRTRGQRDYVRINGRDYPLGPAGSAEAKREYARLCQLASSGQLDTPFHSRDLTVTEAIARFKGYAEDRYQRSNEASNYRSALRPLRRLFGAEPVAEIGPRRLKQVLAALAEGHCRKVANRHLGRVKTFFRWLQSEELLPRGQYEDLRTVRGLEYGQGREKPPVRPVAEEVIAATLAQANPTIRAIAEVQLLTGARGGELLGLTPGDFLRAGRIELVPGLPVDLGAVWAVDLAAHKTRHKGRRRILLFGPRAQTVLAPWLEGRPSDRPLWSPWEAYERFLRETGRKVRTNRKRKPADRYTPCSYGQGIDYACDRAFPPPGLLAKQPGECWRQWHQRLTEEQHAEVLAWRKAHRWHPHQLRHAAATRLRAQFGLEIARVILGHASADVTVTYALEDLRAAAEAMGKVG